MSQFNVNGWKPGERCKPKVNTGEGRTKQQFRDECNINKIIAKYEKTGMIDHLSEKQPFYGDVSEFKDYQSALDMVFKAQELFRGLSADIKDRFHQDPAEFIKFFEDPNNLQEAVDLGMALPVPEKPVEPVKPAEGVK